MEISMKKIMEYIQRTLRQTQGSSLVSVIVAFVILTLGILMVTTAVKVSLDVTNQALLNRSAVEEALEAFYTGGKGDEKADISEMIPMKSINGDGSEIEEYGEEFSLEKGRAVEFKFQKKEEQKEKKYNFYYFSYKSAADEG